MLISFRGKNLWKNSLKLCLSKNYFNHNWKIAMKIHILPVGGPPSCCVFLPVLGDPLDLELSLVVCPIFVLVLDLSWDILWLSKPLLPMTGATLRPELDCCCWKEIIDFHKVVEVQKMYYSKFCIEFLILQSLVLKIPLWERQFQKLHFLCWIEFIHDFKILNLK